MKKEERKRRLTLTLWVSTFVFGIILISLAVAIVFVLIMLWTGILSSSDGVPDLAYVLLFLTLISLVVGFLLTALAGKIALNPVNSYINHMNRLASGDFKVRLRLGKVVRQIPVLEEITDSFNKMAEELENTEMLRSDFINNFSHEFKTPIVSIAGFAKLLRRGNLTEQQQEEYLRVIEEESLRLSDMATNVLNLTKIESQSILTDVTCYNLSEQLRTCVLLLEDKWSEKNIDFDIVFAEYQIRANEELLKQVWINLIDNAIKFTEPGGMIEIDISSGASYLEVSIKNPGREIPKESVNRIFNKFYQADESHSSEGNGIGLAVVKRVAELHSGVVDVQCENGFVTFTVKLPDVAEG